MTRAAARRRGFTLVELLVAIALAIVILGLTIYIVNTATFDSYKVVGSGDRLSQWLIQAKNRALRDKAPRGLRLIINNGLVTECAFIEQSEPWVRPTPTKPDDGNDPLVQKPVRLHFLYQSSGTTVPVGSNQRRVF